MSISDDLLRDEVETSFNSIPELPGRLEHLRVPGIQGRVTSISHPLANLVTAARLDASSVDDTIRTVKDFYAERGLMFGWVVGPSTQPEDLGQRLEACGLTKGGEMAALVLTDLCQPVATNPDIEILEIVPGDFQEFSVLAAESFPIPEGLASLFFEAISTSRKAERAKLYVAFVAGLPVSWAMSSYAYKGRIVQLAGAATTAQHRGKGVYTSLVARRLEDARADGAEAALIQAVTTTSAPICRKIGFRDIGRIDMYVGAPPPAGV